MRIFIDARMTHIGGNYTYTVNLLHNLIEHDAENNEYFILYNKGQTKIFPEKSKSLEMFSHRPILWILWDRFVLPKIIARNNIDIFHSFKRADICGIKTKKIITIHSVYPFKYPEFQSKSEKIYWNFILRKAANCCDALLVVSETDRQNFIKVLNLAPDKVFSHHLGLSNDIKRVESDKVIERVKKKYSLPTKYLLFVGSFYLFKNIPNIIRAFKKAKKVFGIGHKLVLVGQNGSGSREVYKTIKELGIENEILMTGPITDDLSSIYTAAHAFLFPTYYDSFGFPVLEAMACGVPTIISTTGALPEVAGDAALQVEPNDVNSLAEAIYRVVTDENLRSELIMKGYEKIKEYTWKRCAKETVDVYKYINQS